VRATPVGLTQAEPRARTVAALRTRQDDGAYSRLVGAVAFLLAALAVAWADRAGVLVLYGDGASHLVMSRRIFDSLTPGLAQIGTTWLPLPHLLVQPFIYVDWLYQTGLAASLVGIACYVLTCVFVYRLCYLATRSEPAALVGAAVVGLNPNVLYIQATPLTEPAMLVTFAGAAYFLVRWSRTFAMLDLVLAGYCTCLASLARYDGWMLMVAGFGLVPVVALLARRGRQFAEAHALAFLAMAINGPLLWMLYHLLIFHDPIYFIRNPFSAEAQQDALVAAAALPTKGNLLLSVAVYNWAVLDNVGAALAALGVVGLLLFALRNWRRPLAAATLLLLAPYAFNIVALVIGQSTIVLPQFSAFGQIHNARYGLMGLLPLAFGIACCVPWLRRFWPAAALVVLLQSAALVASGQVIVYQEAWKDSAGSKVEVADWLREHYDGGLVLMDPYLAARGQAGASVIWRTGLPLHNFVNDGNHPYWEDALRDPRGVRWVVIVPGDRLEEDFDGGQRLEPWFEPVYAGPEATIYRRLPDATTGAEQRG